MRTLAVVASLCAGGVLAVPSTSGIAVSSPDGAYARSWPDIGAETLAVSARGLSADPAPLLRARTTVVLIPGPVGSAFSMRHITTALAEQAIPTVVIDPLGMGASARPEKADYSLTRQAARIASVLDTLHLSRVLLVAQGTSATVALHMAADSHERIAGVLSLAGGPVDHQGTKGVKLALAFSSLLDNALGRAIGRRKFVAAIREQSANDAWCTPAVVREYLRPYEQDLRGSLRALRSMSESVEPAPIASRLASVQVPVQLLVGDKRSANAPTDEQIRVLQQGLRVFRVDTVRNAGTLLQEERADAVVQAITAQLARIPAPLSAPLPAPQQLRR